MNGEQDKLAELIELLALERLEENLFRGQSQDLGWGTVFGGQVLGQALSAAAQTVPEERQVHSMHGYFLRPGRVNRAVIYEIDRIRDGKSFTTRRVVAIQGGRAIFNLSASFQIEEDGLSHQDPLPPIRGPEGLFSEQQWAHKVADKIPAPLRERALGNRPIELRPVDPINPMNPVVKDANHAVWFRAAHKLPDTPALHRYLLAYASDMSFLPTAMRPHGVTWLTSGMQVASLDHAMWFHRPFRLDEWLLHVVDSPSASGARGLVRGRWFTEDGVMVASTMQEGLMRKRGRKPS